MAKEIGAILEELHHVANRWATELANGKPLLDINFEVQH
jgi:hypothetical protein